MTYIHMYVHNNVVVDAYVCTRTNTSTSTSTGKYIQYRYCTLLYERVEEATDGDESADMQFFVG